MHSLQAYDELNTHANWRLKTDINKRTLVRRGPRPLARAGLCAGNQVDHQLAVDDSGVAPPTATMASVAVLPVVNLGANAADMHASDGLSDELIGTLGLVPGLLVIARTSVFAPRDRSLGRRDVTTLDSHQDLGWQQLGYPHLLRGENMQAVAARRCASALSGARHSAHLAYALVVSGDAVQARRITGQLERTAGTPKALVVRLAIAYAGLGDRDRAFALLERRYALRASFMIGLAMEPALRS